MSWRGQAGDPWPLYRLRKFPKVSFNTISGTTVTLPENEQPFKNVAAKPDLKNITKQDACIGENSCRALAPSRQNTDGLHF
jgi:hypothetical protein